MFLLNFLRLSTFGFVALLDMLILGTSSFMNSKTTPMFHYTMYSFPWALSLISLVVVPSITILERKTRNKPESPLAFISSVMVELPLFVLLLVLWFVCARAGISEFFGPFKHCDEGAGVGVMSAGLEVSSHCRIVGVIHGASWLATFAFLFLTTVSVVFAFFTFLRQGGNVFKMRLSQLSVNGASAPVPSKQVF